MRRKPIRRHGNGTACPACGDTGVRRETTVKGYAVAVYWKCTACKKTWRNSGATKR